MLNCKASTYQVKLLLINRLTDNNIPFSIVNSVPSQTNLLAESETEIDKLLKISTVHKFGFLCEKDVDQKYDFKSVF